MFRKIKLNSLFIKRSSQQSANVKGLLAAAQLARPNLDRAQRLRARTTLNLRTFPGLCFPREKNFAISCRIFWPAVNFFPFFAWEGLPFTGAAFLIEGDIFFVCNLGFFAWELGGLALCGSSFRRWRRYLHCLQFDFLCLEGLTLYRNSFRSWRRLPNLHCFQSKEKRKDKII